MAHEDIQLLLGDRSILSLAQQHLGYQPVLDSVTMWWSTSFKKVEGSGLRVVEANPHLKAVLRVAAEEFAKRRHGVHYLPSYELVTVSSEQPWAVKQRHVTESTVASAMKLLHGMYDSEQPS